MIATPQIKRVKYTQKPEFESCRSVEEVIGPAIQNQGGQELNRAMLSELYRETGLQKLPQVLNLISKQGNKKPDTSAVSTSGLGIHQ